MTTYYTRKIYKQINKRKQKKEKNDNKTFKTKKKQIKYKDSELYK